MSDLRVGIVGGGFIAGVHVGAYHATPGVRIVGVADPSTQKAERLAAQVGARAVAGLDELLEVGVDLVSICTPTPTHPALVEQALGAGVHVLCEKPIARTTAEAQRIVDAARGADTILMVGHVSRFEPDHARAAEIVAAGRIGALQMVSQSITGSMPDWSEGGWLADRAQSGGPVLDLAIHSFDYLTWINGSPPIRVHAVAADTPAAGPAGYALITLRFANGAIGLVETSWAHPASHGFKVATELIGSEGRLSWDYDGLIVGGMHVADGADARFDPLGDRGFRAEIGALLDAIRTGGPSPVPAEEATASLRTALAALESLETGRTVELGARASARETSA